MLRIFHILLLIVVLAFIPVARVEASSNLSTDLEAAQEALAKGEYDQAYAAFYKSALEEQNPLAEFSVGLFYENGWGREIDKKHACQWFEKAAKADIPAAAHFTAECFLKGTHKPASSQKAAVFFERAAGLGHYSSYCSLAELYFAGDGVEKNPAKAIELCLMAFQHNVPTAAMVIGQFYFSPNSSLHDYGEARQWFLSAAQNNTLKAFYYLGIMARDGLGQEKDLTKAAEWFELASSRGYGPAYLETAKIYFGDPADGLHPSEQALAKAYLWSSVAVKGIDSSQKTEAQSLLVEVKKIMPGTWTKSLDAKVAAHLSKFQ